MVSDRPIAGFQQGIVFGAVEQEAPETQLFGNGPSLFPAVMEHKI